MQKFDKENISNDTKYMSTILCIVSVLNSPNTKSYTCLKVNGLNFDTVHKRLVHRTTLVTMTEEQLVAEGSKPNVSCSNFQVTPKFKLVGKESNLRGSLIIVSKFNMKSSMTTANGYVLYNPKFKNATDILFLWTTKRLVTYCAKCKEKSDKSPLQNGIFQTIEKEDKSCSYRVMSYPNVLLPELSVTVETIEEEKSHEEIQGVESPKAESNAKTDEEESELNSQITLTEAKKKLLAKAYENGCCADLLYDLAIGDFTEEQIQYCTANIFTKDIYEKCKVFVKPEITVDFMKAYYNLAVFLNKDLNEYLKCSNLSDLEFAFDICYADCLVDTLFDNKRIRDLNAKGLKLAKFPQNKKYKVNKVTKKKLTL